MEIKWYEKLESLFKYIVEGLAITFLGFYLTGRLNETHSVIQVSLTVSVLLATVDAIWPDMSTVVRRGLLTAIGWYFIYHPSFCAKDGDMAAGVMAAGVTSELTSSSGPSA